MVQRYEATGYDCEVAIAADGEYVLYEDYEVIEQLLGYIVSCINEHDLPADAKDDLEKMGLL